MALFSNDKIMSIIMLVAIIIITLLLESYSSYVKMEAFAAATSTSTNKSNVKAVGNTKTLNITR